MSDEIDYYNDTLNSQQTKRKSLYTRCSHCHEFYRMEPGVPCPNPKCTGRMV